MYSNADNHRLNKKKHPLPFSLSYFFEIKPLFTLYSYRLHVIVIKCVVNIYKILFIHKFTNNQMRN